MIKKDLNLLKNFSIRFLLLIACTTLNNANAESNKLAASLAFIPIHSEIKEGKPVGGFVDVVHLLNDYFPEKNVEITQFPFARSISNIVHSRADFHLPLIKSPNVNVEELDFYYVDEPMCKVTFVLYTLGDRPEITPITASDYLIETQRGHKNMFPFQVGEVNDLEMALKKLLLGRIDGFIFEQEAVDSYLKRHKIKKIHRQFYASYDSAIIVPKTAEGLATSNLLSQALKALKRDGRLQAITQSIHKPYQHWQPTS